jgi:hypothetical protein
MRPIWLLHSSSDASSTYAEVKTEREGEEEGSATSLPWASVVAMPAGVGVGHAMVEVECPNPVATIVLQFGKLKWIEFQPRTLTSLQSP